MHWTILVLPQLAAWSPPTIRRAVWPDDYKALCDVRKPTAFVVEEGSSGFLGQRTELTPEMAFERRVQARLGSALKDNAIVLLAEMARDEGAEVVGTIDCVPLTPGDGRRAGASPLPARFLLRNVWVSESQRRRGIGTHLMHAAEDLAREEGVPCLYLEVARENQPAVSLYAALGYTEYDAAPAWMPQWALGPCALTKEVSLDGS